MCLAQQRHRSLSRGEGHLSSVRELALYLCLDKPDSQFQDNQSLDS